MASNKHITLAELRRRKGLTQVQLGARTSLPQNIISRIERRDVEEVPDGLDSVHLKTLRTVLTAMGYRIVLLDEDDQIIKNEDGTPRTL